LAAAKRGRTLKRPVADSPIADHAINGVAKRREAREDGSSRLKKPNVNRT